MGADRTKIWHSVGLQERFKRADLLKMLFLAVDGIFILIALVYHKVVRFCNNACTTLKVKRDDAEEDDIDDYQTAYVYGSPRASQSVEKKNYINQVTLYQSGCLTITRNVTFELKSLLERSVEKQNDVYTCFIDYSKAFDTVYFSIVLIICSRIAKSVPRGT